MKKIAIYLICFILLFMASLYANYGRAFAVNSQEFSESYAEHIFIHCLIAYPEIAFQKNNPMKTAYEKDCITSDEFLSMLNELYSNNYVLVDINKTFKVTSNGTAEKVKVAVPKNKKPLILSVDDVVYDHKKAGKGMVDKIILDSKGNFATSTLINGKEDISYNKEFVCILENFILSHPDFTMDNARATLNLTGFDGILGYRTQKSNIINRETEIKKAREVVGALKKKGYSFACHSYGHYHMKKLSVSAFKQELDLWNDEVVPLIGKTNIYVYPYGEYDLVENNDLSEKQKLLVDDGFKLFCGVGIKDFYGYMPYYLNTKNKVLFMDRKPIDGITLSQRATELSNLFNASAVIDKTRTSII